MALTFNGTSDGISVTGVAALETPSSQVSVCCWLMRDGNQGAFDRIVEKEYENSTVTPFVSYGFEWGSATELYFLIGNAGSVTTSSQAITNLTWTHILGTFTTADDTLRLYVNGTETDTGSGGGGGNIAYSATGNQFDIGARDAATTADLFMKGSIAEVAVWAESLSAGEAAALAKGYSPLFIRPSALVYYSPLLRSHQDRMNAAVATTTGTTAASHPRIIMPRGRQLGKLIAAVQTGRIWRLAGIGGGLVGKQIGLAG